MKARYIVFAAAAAASLGMSAADFKPADVLVYTRWDHVKNQKTGEVKKGGFDALPEDALAAIEKVVEEAKKLGK